MCVCVYVCVRERESDGEKGGEREVGRGREEEICKEAEIGRGGIEGGRDDDVCVCVCVCVRERERERERDMDRTGKR